MQVTLMLDDNLLQQAMQVSGITTTQEVMERALQTLIQLNQQPVSWLTSTFNPPRRTTPRQAGLLADDLKIADDFDAPLPESVLAAFRGEAP
jgi:Bacterial antitoxin of type II TA system, VapB